MKDTPLTQLDLTYLPQPIAEQCWNFANCSEEAHLERFTRALQIYEALLRICSMTAVSLYLTESEKLASGDEGSKTNEVIAGLDAAPSTGHWAGALRLVINSFAKRKADLPELASKLTDYYTSKLSGGREGDAFSGLSLLAQLLSIRAPKPNVGSAFDFLAAARNKTTGHGAILNPVDTQRSATALEATVAELIATASFFRKWQLIHVDRVEKRRGQLFLYEAKVFTNQRVTRTKFTQEPAQNEICVDGEVYLVNAVAPDSGNVPILRNALSLKPYLLYSTCPETKSDQLFFHNLLKNGTREYLCYATGVSLTPPDLERDFKNIRKVIRGDLRPSDVFRPLTASSERIATPEERRQAEMLADQAVTSVRGGNTETAVELAADALQLHRHCAKAIFARGLALWELREPLQAKSAFAKAHELRPNDAASLLALALAHTITEDNDAAVRAFRSLAKVDSNNKWSTMALERRDDIDSAIFRNASSNEAKMGAAVEAVFQQLEEETIEVVSWLYRLPPWKQIYSLSKRRHSPVSPYFSSAIGAFLIFVVPVIIHLPTLLDSGIQSSESKALFARHAIIAIICFCGLSYVFLISALFKKAYQKLSKIVMVPRAAFRQWFISEISSAWGCGNEDPKPNGVTKTAPLFTSDCKLFLGFLLAFIVFLPVQYFCSGDFLLTSPLPSEINNSLRLPAGETDIPVSWAVTQSLTRHSIYYLQLYLCVYCIPLLFPVIRLIRKLPKHPIRYFPGIQDSLTLKPLSGVFINLALLGFVFSVLILAQLFVYRSYGSFAAAAWTYVIAVFIGMLWYVCAPSWVIHGVMRTQREKVMEEFSVNLEKAYNASLIKPDGPTFDTLAERSRFIRMIKKLCPVFPLSISNMVLSFALILGTLTAIAVYLYTTLYLGLPKF